MRVKIGRTITILLIIIIGVHLIFMIIIGFQVFQLRLDNPKSTSIMRYRNKNGQIDNQVNPPTFTPLILIPADIKQTVVYIEDFRFYRHYGFDIESIKFAIALNKRLGYYAYGGSTITQQLARTLFLTPQKLLIRKYLELIISLELELLLSKDRILELYFNYAEWGAGVYGITDGAYHHFNKSIDELDSQNKAILITLLASPFKYNIESFSKNEMLRLRYEAVKSFIDYIITQPIEFKSTIRHK